MNVEKQREVIRLWKRWTREKEESGIDRHIQVSVPVETVRAAEDKAARKHH